MAELIQIVSCGTPGPFNPAYSISRSQGINGNETQKQAGWSNTVSMIEHRKLTPSVPVSVLWSFQYYATGNGIGKQNRCFIPMFHQSRQTFQKRNPFGAHNWNLDKTRLICINLDFNHLDRSYIFHISDTLACVKWPHGLQICRQNFPHMYVFKCHCVLIGYDMSTFGLIFWIL